MLRPGQVEEYRKRAAAALRRAGVVLTAAEEAGIEIADFGLGEFEVHGLALLVYVNTERYCAKELVLLPGQASMLAICSLEPIFVSPSVVPVAVSLQKSRRVRLPSAIVVLLSGTGQ